MESGKSGLSLPRNLARILSNLGITGKPTKWNLSSMECEYSLTLMWKKNEEKEQDFGGFETIQEPKLSTSSSDCDSPRPGRSCGKRKEAFVEQFLPDNWEKLVSNARKADFLQAEVSKNARGQDDHLRFESSTFEKEYNSLPFKDAKKGKGKIGSKHETKRHQKFQTHKTSAVKVAVNHSPPYSCHSNKAKCSCGEEFQFKERAIKHILFSCPVSLCFRIDLDLRIHRAIDKWREEEQRILGRKWWHAYKTSGFPDERMSFPENALDELESMVNEFLAKAESDKFEDKGNKKFVLMKGIGRLPYELEGMEVIKRKFRH